MMINKINIVLLEDNDIDRFKIKNAIKFCLSQNREMTNGFELCIEDFDLDDVYDLNEVQESLLSRINDEECQTIIVDYKLLPKNSYIDGNNIFKYIRETISSFPIVMLTQLPDECKKENNVDLDKIYEKKDFFSDDSNLPEKIVRNAVQYVNSFNELQTCIDKLVLDDTNDYEEYLKLQVKLSNYIPLSFKEDTIKKFSKQYDTIIDLINKIEKALNEKK